MPQSSSRRAITPPLSTGTKHFDTPTRTAVLAVSDFVDTLSPTIRRRRGITKKKLYKKLQVPERTARKIVRTRETRRSNHVETKPERRGRKKILTDKDVHYAEQQLLRYPDKTRRLNWLGLVKFYGFTCSAITIQRAIGQLNYRRCKSCQRNWVSEKCITLRVKFTKTILARYPRSED